LMMESNTGVSGIGSNGGIETHVSNLSALNKSSGHLRLSNVDYDLAVENLSGISGLNANVYGYNGVTNCAVGGEVNLEVLNGEGVDLDINDPIHSYGNVFLYAEDDIRQSDLGSIWIHNPYSLPGAPTNLTSPSHIVGALSTDRTVDVTWMLPEAVPAYGLAAYAGDYYAQAPGTQIKTNGGDVMIIAGNAIALSLINAGNANVALGVMNGDITDNDGGSTPGDYDVIGRNIQMVAPGGSVSPLVDLGHPYEFSYLWDNAAISFPDLSVDSYTESYDPVTGDWTFATTSDELANGSWWFHVSALDYPVEDYSPCGGGECGPRKKLSEDFEGPSEYLGDDCGEEIVSGPPAHIGPFIFSDIPPPPPDPEDPTYWEQLQEFRVYYEILDPSQFLAFEPAQKIGLYAYHPLSSADLSAFDNIRLDAGAYDFIDDNLEMKKKANQYFGL